jgi:hypothetical protein
VLRVDHRRDRDIGVRRWLRLWFTFEERVGRREYVVSGLVLALVKYAGDAALVWAATGRISRIHGRVLGHVRALAEAD